MQFGALEEMGILSHCVSLSFCLPVIPSGKVRDSFGFLHFVVYHITL